MCHFLLVCGRFSLTELKKVLEEMFSMQIDFDFMNNPDFRPTDSILVFHEKAQLMRWQLIPNWAREIPKNVSSFNARSEEAHEKPMFRDAFSRAQRCLIPASAFFEWKHEGKVKTKYAFQTTDTPVLAIAGLWDKATIKGETIYSCTILTTEANDVVKPIHAKNRMPVLVHPRDFKTWLSKDVSSANAFRLAVPYPAQQMLAKKADSGLPPPGNKSQLNLF